LEEEKEMGMLSDRRCCGYAVMLSPHQASEEEKKSLGERKKAHIIPFEAGEKTPLGRRSTEATRASSPSKRQLFVEDCLVSPPDCLVLREEEGFYLGQ